MGADASGDAFCGSDQAWLAHSLGWGEATWGEADGVQWFKPGSWSNKMRPAILFFPGKRKPWDYAPYKIYPFITNNYRVAEREAA